MNISLPNNQYGFAIAVVVDNQNAATKTAKIEEVLTADDFTCDFSQEISKNIALYLTDHGVGKNIMVATKIQETTAAFKGEDIDKKAMLAQLKKIVAKLERELKPASPAPKSQNKRKKRK